MPTEPADPVHVALAKVMADVRAVGKEGHNSAQNFNFRGIDGVLNAVGPALRTHQVVVLPQLVSIDQKDVEVGRNRTLMGHVTLQFRYVFVGPDGSTLEAIVPGEAMDSGDKAVSKAMSVALRTALIQCLALPTDQPDPDETSYERSEAPPPGMTASQQTEISEGIAGLSDDGRSQLRDWMKKQRLSVKSLDHGQAVTVLAKLDEMLSAPFSGSDADQASEPTEPAPNASTGDSEPSGAML